MKRVNQSKMTGRMGFFVRALVSATAIIPMFLFLAGTSSPAMAANGNERGSVALAAEPGYGPEGSTVNYTVTVQNGAQAGVYTLVNDLPNNTTFSSANTECTLHNGRLSCDLALFPDDVVTVSYTVTVDADARCGAVLRNTSRVRSWPAATVENAVFCP